MDSIVATRREWLVVNIPALKRRAKFTATLRVEDSLPVNLSKNDIECADDCNYISHEMADAHLFQRL